MRSMWGAADLIQCGACVAVCCSVLQCFAVCATCNPDSKNIPYTWHDTQLTHTKHCNTLQHTATHCNTLQHAATHCNTLQHMTWYSTHTYETNLFYFPWFSGSLQLWITGSLQLNSHILHTAPHCTTLQYTATHCNTLQLNSHIPNKFIWLSWIFVVLNTYSCRRRSGKWTADSSSS